MTTADPAAAAAGAAPAPAAVEAGGGAEPPGKRRSAGWWVGSTYFAEGFPYAIVVNLAPLYFVALGANVKEVGLTQLFHLPWNLKALVGPFLDSYGTKRKWLLGIELLLGVALLVFAFTTSLSTVLLLASGMFLVLAILSATHDIAIDGLYLEALDKRDQETWVGLRAPAYRFAMFVVTGPIAFLCDRVGWSLGLAFMAACMGAMLAFHIVMLPRTEVDKRPFSELLRQLLSLRFFAVIVAIALLIAGGRAALASAWFASAKGAVAAAAPKLAEQIGKRGAADWIGLSLLLALVVILALLPTIRRRIEGSSSSYARSFVSFLAQPYAGRILLYVILFRVGESFLMTMKTPFCRTTLELSQAEYAVVNGSIGMIFGLIAPAIGGLLIAKIGFRRCIWPFLIAQNGLHLVFALAAVFSTEIAAARDPLVSHVVLGQVVTLVDVRIAVVTAVIIVEIIGAGLGTAAFMIYILRSCLPEHKAAHMALLTSLMSVAFTLAGVFSGFLVEWMGYALFFAMTFVVTLPHMALTLFVPHIDERGAPPSLGRTA